MTETAEVVFESLATGVTPPRRATAESAGFDLRARFWRGKVQVHRAGEAESRAELVQSEGGTRFVTLAPGDRALVPTGFKARLPAGHVAEIRMRSSVAWKHGLTVPNAPGTVDADYPGEWFVLVLNAGPADVRVLEGERIAQAVVLRYAVPVWRTGQVGTTTQRTGGLGSTSEPPPERG